MFKSKRFLLALVAVAVVASASLVGAGQWNNSFPRVNGNAYCASTVNGVCNSTIPAGPALTGLETVPVDTNVASGASPQTAIMGIGQLGGGKTTYLVPLTTDSVTIDAATRQLIINPIGTIAAFTVVFPASTLLTQADGQRFGFCSTQIVTTLTVTQGAGTTVSNAPTAMLVPVATGAGSCVEWVYRVANTTWFRTQ